MKKFISSPQTRQFLQVFALFFATYVANSRCMFIYHNPEVPNSVKSLRKHK